MKLFTDMQYDEFLAFMDEVRKQVGPIEYVAARSVEEAEAFAYWCIDNEIKEPRIIVAE